MTGVFFVQKRGVVMAEVDRLEVVIQSDIDKVNRELDSLIKRLGTVASGLDAIRNNKGLGDFAQQAKQMSENAKEIGKNMQESVSRAVSSTQQQIKKVTQSFEELANKYKDLGKGFKFEGNVEGLKNQIESYTNQLEKAKLKKYELESAGKTDTPQYENAIRDVMKYQNVLESLKAQLDNIGKPKMEGAFSPQLVDRLREMEEQEKEFLNSVKNGTKEVEQEVQKVGKSMSQGFIPPEKATSDLDRIRERIDYLDGKFKDVGKGFVFNGNMKELQAEIEKTEKALDRLYDKQDRQIDLGQYSGKGFEATIRDINEMQNRLDVLRNQQNEIPPLRLNVGSINEGLENVKSKMASFKEMLAKFKIVIPTKDMKKTQDDIEKVKQKYAETMNYIKKRMSEDQGYSNTGEFYKKQAEIEALKQEYDSLIQKQNELSRVGGGGYTFNFEPVIKAVSKLGSLISSVTKKFVKMISPIKAAQRALDALNLDKLSKSITRVFSMLKTMILRKALREVIESIGNGFNTLAQQSAEFGNNVNNLKSALATLGNSIAAAASPLINALTPALMVIIEWCTKAVNAINQLISALTGKNTWFKATKVATGAGNAVKGAGKKAKEAAKDVMKGIRAFDELKTISLPEQNDSDSSGGGGGAGGGGGFEEVPIDDKIKEWAQKLKDMWKKGDFTELGKFLGTKLRDALNSIDWNPIKATAKKVGKSLATLINGFVSVPGLAHSIGMTLAEIINTGVQGVTAFLDYTDFMAIGEFIGNGLNSLVDYIDWETIGHMFAQYFNDVLGMIGEAARTFEWDELGQSLSDGFNKFVSDFDWIGNGTDVGDLVKGLATTISEFIAKTDWGAFGTGIAQFINSLWKKINETIDTVDWYAIGKGIVDFIGGFFKTFNWKNVSGTISSLFKALLNFMTGIIQNINWKEVPGYIVKAIADFIKGFDWKGVMSALGTLLGAALKAAIDALGSIWDMLKKAWGKVEDYFKGYIDEAGGNIIKGLFNGIINALADVGKWIYDNILEPFMEGFQDAFQIHSPSKLMEEQGNFIIEGLKLGIKNAWEGFKDFWSDKWDDLKNSCSNAWEKIKTESSNKVTALKTTLGTKFKTIKTDTVNAWTEIKDKGKEAIDLLKTETENKFETIKSKISDSMTTAGTKLIDFKGKVESTTTAVVKFLAESGKKFFIDLPQKAFETFKTAVNNVVAKINEFFKKNNIPFNIPLPSELFDAFKNKVGETYDKVVTFMKESGKSFSLKLPTDTFNKFFDAIKKVVDWLAKLFSYNNKEVNISTKKDGGYIKPDPKKDGGFIKKFDVGGYTPRSYSLFMAGENGIPEILGTVGGRNAVAGGREITGIRDAVNANGAAEAQLLANAVSLLRVIADKDFGITQNDLGRSVQLYSREFEKRTGRPAF